MHKREKWILDITEKLQHQDGLSDEGSQIKAIYRVPKFLKDVAESQSYEPKLASFGPYHHGRRHLRPMEQQKEHALIRYLRRIDKTSKKTLEDVFIAMKKVESHLLASYDSLDDNEDDGLDPAWRRKWLEEKDEFLKLMIVDGCFALELMLAYTGCTNKNQSNYNSQESAFGNMENLYFTPVLQRDMLLLENQIPLLALFTLANIARIGDVIILIRDFYNLHPASFSMFDYRSTFNCFHILDLYKELNGYPSKKINYEEKFLLSFEMNKRSATELINIGVSFCKSKTKCFEDISFNGGILSVPQRVIDEFTESMLLNLMAFEYMHATAGKKVRAYVSFMDGLIDNADDVALLRYKGIIIGCAGRDEEIANMFNRINKYLKVFIYKDDMKQNVDNQLNIYYAKRIRRWRAIFFHIYLKNPAFFRAYFMHPWIAFTVLTTIYIFWNTIIQFVSKIQTELSLISHWHKYL